MSNRIGRLIFNPELLFFLRLVLGGVFIAASLGKNFDPRYSQQSVGKSSL